MRYHFYVQELGTAAARVWVYGLLENQAYLSELRRLAEGNIRKRGEVEEQAENAGQTPRVERELVHSNGLLRGLTQLPIAKFPPLARGSGVCVAPFRADLAPKRTRIWGFLAELSSQLPLRALGTLI